MLGIGTGESNDKSDIKYSTTTPTMTQMEKDEILFQKLQKEKEEEDRRRKIAEEAARKAKQKQI